MNIPRYRLSARGRLMPDPKGKLMLCSDIAPMLDEMLNEQGRLTSILAAVLHEHHNDILEVPIEAMNALAGHGKTFKYERGANGQELVLRVVDGPKAEEDEDEA